MIIKTAQAESFVAKPPAGVKVFLLFGPDHGLVADWAKQLCAQIVPGMDDPFRVAVLENDAIVADPVRLADEVAAQAFGGGTRLVVVKEADDRIALALGKVLPEMGRYDCRLVMTAGELGKNSKLRALCEKDDAAVAIAAYAEEGRARTALIDKLLRAENLQVGAETLELIALHTPADRLALKSEIAKLVTYAAGQKTITEADVRAALGDGSEAELDALMQHIGEGRVQAASAVLDRLYQESVVSVQILRALQRHFLRLQQARDLMNDGMSARDAVKALRPPVFWKQEDSLVRQSQKWTTPVLARALQLLQQAETQCKQTGLPDQTICRQTALQLARAA